MARETIERIPYGSERGTVASGNGGGHPDNGRCHVEPVPALELKRLREYPKIRLAGNMDDALLDRFFSRRDELVNGPDGPPARLLLELSTQGGTADYGERLAEEVRLLREAAATECLFLGNSFVFSAGVTVMTAFPVAQRFLTADTWLLIHERRMDKQVHLSSPLSAAVPQVRALLAEVEYGLALQERGFARLVEGSAMSLDELRERAREDWYVSAEEALRRGLVAGVV